MQRWGGCSEGSGGRTGDRVRARMWSDMRGSLYVVDDLTFLIYYITFVTGCNIGYLVLQITWIFLA